MSSSRKYPYQPRGKLTEIQGEGGVKSPIFCKGKYGAKLEFLRGWKGGQTKKPSVGRVWIFSGTTKLLHHVNVTMAASM